MGNKILLADDSITIQKVIELTFSDEDFEVVTVGNGRLAIEKVQEVRPDVVLCDVIMPEKDGYEVCDFIKKSATLAHTPVLLLTGAFEPFDQERAARVGCDGFLAKPFEPETLIARVKDLLSKAARPAAAPAPAPAAAPSPRPPAPPPPPPEAAVAPPPFVPPIAPQPFAPAPAPSPFVSSATTPAAAMADDSEIAFIPDEPFDDLDSPDLTSAVAEASAAVASAPMAEEPVMEEPVEELMPISSEESESLSGGGEDSSTVMFRADALPWTARSAPPPAPADEAPPEVSVLDEVIEADAFETSEEFGTMGGPGTLPPSPPPAPMSPPAPPPQPAASFVEPLAPAPPPPSPAPPAPEPLFQAPFRSPVPAPAPRPAAAPPPPAPVAAPVPPPPPVAEPAVAASSFADVAASLGDPEAEAAKASSVAAQVDVPVDMVSQIAQRVVAQVSEKVVERIAWEVIPDLAEALIKREIERLKAELQHLG
jgi:CheY-like chemotaxis protein